MPLYMSPHIPEISHYAYRPVSPRNACTVSYHPYGLAWMGIANELASTGTGESIPVVISKSLHVLTYIIRYSYNELCF